MRLRNLSFSSDTQASGLTPGVSPTAGPAIPAIDPELSSIRDRAIFLLHTAAEIEHALLVQYLYAFFTAPAGSKPEWTRNILTIAVQEMGHLITVQNVLLAMRAPLNLEREDFPFRRGYYPFEFSLDPFSLKTLARYTLAEMPTTGNGLGATELAKLNSDADVTGGVSNVPALYDLMIDTVSQVDPSEFLGDTAFDLQAMPDEWEGSDADDPAATIVRPVKSREDAVKALRAIAIQGEGSGLNSESHFGKFLTIFREFQAAPLPVAAIASNPNTSGQVPAGAITDQRTAKWAHLFNVQYRLLLHGIWQTLHTSVKDSARVMLANDVAFRHMHRIADLAPVLTSLPLRSDGGAIHAGPTFELPYALNLSADPLGRWLTLRDVLKASDALASELLATETDEGRKAVLKKVIRDSASDPWKTVDEQIAKLQPATDIAELRLLPPLAIARFGSSPDPMDNYDVVTSAGTGPRTLSPAETLTIDPATGSVTAANTPGSVRFRDGNGKIRPVSPFIEAWARFTPDGPIELLTIGRLESLGLTAADVHWRVEVANLKVARRTGAQDDRILAAVDLNGHARTELVGVCANFKAGKSIPFGHVQYIRPTSDFPDIRLRFTPAGGKVYGPNSGDPNVADDVYDSSRGTWDNFVEQDGTRATVPGGIYAGTLNSQTQEFVSLGYIDDSCDGIVTLSIQLKSGKTLSAFARISAGPPAFSPASLPVRTVDDDLRQAAEGPEAAAGSRDEVAAILHRALDTIRLTQTSVMNGNQGIGGVPRNSNNMAGHDTGYGRAFEPIFPPAAVEPALLVARHEAVLNSVLTGGPVSISPRLRAYDRVGDLTDAGRQQMPALTRGADGKYLALTRRQVSTVRRYEESLAPPAPVPVETPRDAMIKLIEHLRDTESAATFHGGVPTGSGQMLQSLFANPPAVLDFLTSGVSKGSFGLPSGQPLVVKGNPGASAFFKILTSNTFMGGKFQTPIASLGNRKGVEIVEAWITSLT